MPVVDTIDSARRSDGGAGFHRLYHRQFYQTCPLQQAFPRSPREVLARLRRRMGSTTPIAVVPHSLHEQIWHPQGVKQIASAMRFQAVVLLRVEEVEDVGVPWLDVDSEAAPCVARPGPHAARRHSRRAAP